MEEKAMKTILTAEESQRLIELGVDPKLASEREYIDKTEEDSNQFLNIEEYPRFTLSDLLSILPKEIEDSNLDIISTQVDIKNHKKVSGWMATYIGSHNDLTFTDGLVFQAPELINALYSLLIWCLENKIIKLKED